MSDPEVSPEFHLLPDEPASADKFGSHDQVAKGIAKIISSGVGGNTIGIEGDWGSGKSTIVGFVEREFESDKDVHVLIFDAWAHEGDPLRRSFLEQLISTLVSLQWVSQNKWDRVLEVIGKRTTDTHSTITRGVTGAGKFVAFAATMVPIGVVIVDSDKLSSRNSIIGMCLVAAPIFVIFVIGVINFFRRKMGLNKIGYLESDRKEEIHSTINQDPEPTSIEFRKYFVSLMSEALGRTESRKLVLVVDNMDRIDVIGASRIWSTLRIFLEKPNDVGRKFLEQLWVIVPYDKSAILSRADNGAQNSSPFRDKVIQTTFYAPAPVLSDWQSFLNDKLKQAFPESTQEFQDQFHRVYRLYAIEHSEQDRRVTPRDLILFVNEIGSLYCQWKEEIPLPELAYYVILRRKGTAIVEGLLGRTVPDQNSLPLLGMNPAADLSAIHYNVNRDKAGQFLLRDPIVDCLEKGDGEALEELLKKHKESRYVLEISLPELINQWLPNETQKFFLCVKALGHCLESLEETQRSASIKEFIAAARRVSVWTKFDIGTVEGIKELLSLDSKLSSEISDSLLASLDTTVSPGGSVFEWPESLEPLVRLLEILEDPGKFKLANYGIVTQANVWLSIAAELVVHDPAGKYWKVLTPEFAEENELNELLVKCFDQAEVPAGAVAAVRISARIGDKTDRTALLTKISQKLTTPDTIEPSSVQQYVDALILLGEQAKEKKWETDWSASGMALHHFYACQNAGEHTSSSYCMIVHLESFPMIAGGTNQHQSANGQQALTNIVGNPSEHADLVDEFIGLVESHGRRGRILAPMITKAPSGAPFVAYCLNKMSCPEFTFQKKSFLDNWSTLTRLIEEDELKEETFLRIVDRQLEKHDLAQSIYDEDFNPGAVILYACVLKSGVSDKKKFAEWLASAVNDLSQDDFSDVIDHNRILLQLFSEIHKIYPAFSLGTAFCDAVVAHGIASIEGHGNAAWIDEIREQVFDLIEIDQRKTLQDQLRNEATKAKGKISKQFFDHYGSEIANPESLLGDNSVVSDLFSSLVKEKNESGINWIIEILETSDFLKFYKPKHRVNAFKKRVEEALRDEDDGDSAIVELARVLGIQKPVNEPDS